MFFNYAGTVQVIPRTATVWVKGRATNTAAPVVDLPDASVQPAEEHDIQTLPEGRRSKGALRVYTSESLLAISSTQKPDHVLIDGVEYEIMSKNKWGNGIIPHYKYVVVEVL